MSGESQAQILKTETQPTATLVTGLGVSLCPSWPGSEKTSRLTARLSSWPGWKTLLRREKEAGARREATAGIWGDFLFPS